MIVKSLDELNKGNLLALWTTSTRPVNPTVGYIGRNTTLGVVETWNGSNWVLVGGGATGGGGDTVFVETSYTVTQDYTITAGKSAITVGDANGDVHLNAGVEVTFADTNSRWVIL